MCGVPGQLDPVAAAPGFADHHHFLLVFEAVCGEEVVALVRAVRGQVQCSAPAPPRSLDTLYCRSGSEPGS